LYRLTPSETTRRASTSRPESVSSSTAIFGFEQVELQDLVALLLAAGEALVDAALAERGVDAAGRPWLP
jgi:hypothetical protein